METPGRLPTRTKIVATIGPASESPEMLRRLILAGVSVMRFNFSHGTLAEHERRLRDVRAIAAEMARPVAVLGDLPGPKIRVGVVPEGGVEVVSGQEIIFERGREMAAIVDGAPTFGVTYPELIGEVEPGQRVLINDGAIRLLAVDHDGQRLRCLVTIGGLITSGKGINLPETSVAVPSLTERDWELTRWAVAHGVDYLALSFVRRAEDITLLRGRIADYACNIGGGQTPIVAKIEKPQAVGNIEAITDAADALMVARGDLGVEMDIAQVPLAQKRIIRACEDWGKPCIVATQMLESMITSAAPTRAEATDVANAIFDGADAVMLSGETAIGRHPDLVVETMHRIARAAEGSGLIKSDEPSPPVQLVASRYQTAALAHGAWHVARDTAAAMVVCWSQHGGTARYLSQNGFAVPIVAYTSDEASSRRMALLRGVTPVLMRPPASGLLGDWTDEVERDLLGRGWVRSGDVVVMLAGKPLGRARATNSIAVLRIGDPNSGYRAHQS
ncbi:MAG: pyruvate kinase [Phycisphaerales bacterium JB039]